MIKPFLILLSLIFLCAYALPLKAQNTPFEPGNEPLEITADQSLEWKRTEQLFIARKNAIAVQGDASVAAETLTAYYKEGSGKQSDSGLDIYKVTAEENVKIKNQDSTAYGDNAVYDLDTGKAVLTGGDLKLISPGQTITAQERFEYWLNDGRAIAVGRPRVIRPKVGGGQDILDADELTATFKNNAQGEQGIDTLEAKGNVVITTPTEIIKGTYGLYKGQSNTAELTGGVTITRGPNILEGEKALVNLNTNTSEIFGGTSAGGRVKGVFYPGSEKKNKDKKTEQPANLQTTNTSEKPIDVQAGAVPSIEPSAPAVEIAPEALPPVRVQTAPSEQQELPAPSPANIEPQAGDTSAEDGWAPLTGYP